jgi:hypothetical protein
MATLYITIVLPWKLYEYAADVRCSFKWREIFYARTKGKTLSSQSEKRTSPGQI